MDRTKTLLSLFDPSGFGLEIGPSFRPLLPKSAGYNVETVDHADAETLRKKYSDNASQIEEVDYVSDGGSLLDLIGQPGRYDFIFASHVIEHVTDIVRFIRDCEKLLKPDGVLVLVVPDKRFCFDALRPVSTVGEALQAFAEARTRHTAGMLFDHINMISTKAGSITWTEPDLDNIELQHNSELARREFELAQQSDEYRDVHGWQFTPAHFQYFINTLRKTGYIESGVKSFRTNNHGSALKYEFYAILSKSAPPCTIPDIELLKAAERDLLVISPSGDAKDADATLRLRLANAEGELLALRNSTSWRLTAPLRYLKARLAARG